jgi:hypothetical protein
VKEGDAMGRFTELFARRKKTPAVKPESRPAPPPAEPDDPPGRLDAELRERITASHEALVQRIMRDGTDGVGFSSGDGLGLSREQRLERIFASLRRS